MDVPVHGGREVKVTAGNEVRIVETRMVITFSLLFMTAAKVVYSPISPASTLT